MFWERLDHLLRTQPMVVDRPKGSHHPKYVHREYPVDYGYLDGTTTIDGEGIDIFVGTSPDDTMQGILCTVDLVKRDAELKLIYRCTPDEIAAVERFIEGEFMSCVFIANPMTASRRPR